MSPHQPLSLCFQFHSPTSSTPFFLGHCQNKQWDHHQEQAETKTSPGKQRARADRLALASLRGEVTVPRLTGSHWRRPHAAPGVKGSGQAALRDQLEALGSRAPVRRLTVGYAWSLSANSSLTPSHTHIRHVSKKRLQIIESRCGTEHGLSLLMVAGAA